MQPLAASQTGWRQQDIDEVWWVTRVTASEPASEGDLAETVSMRVGVRLDRRERRGAFVECYFPEAATETIDVNAEALRDQRPTAVPTIEHARNLPDVREFVLSLA